MTPTPEATTDGSETDTCSQEFDLDNDLLPDEMASQLNKKADNLINSRKRRRPSKISPIYGGNFRILGEIIISPRIRSNAVKKSENCS